MRAVLVVAFAVLAAALPVGGVSAQQEEEKAVVGVWAPPEKDSAFEIYPCEQGRYCGKITMITMAISGALAGLLAVNEILGVQGRLLLEFSSGYGFIGIAVALMGRAHPLGIILAAILFGMLYQGGTELSFEMPRVTRDMIVAISGLVILFAGALDGLIRRPMAGAFARLLKSEG